MTASNFPACLKIILREEGGNDDDPRDRGGRTSRGITQREWDKYRKMHSGLPSDVWKAPQKDINTIYKNSYWNPYCDDFPSGIDLLFFNAAVNSGPKQAAKELQRALGVSVDGIIGSETINAVNNYPDYNNLVSKLSNQRRSFYKSLKQFPIYGKGWMARTDRIESEAEDMVQESPKVAETETFSAKAEPEEESTSVSETIEKASDLIDSANTIVTKVKPITKSRISWGAVGLGASGVASAASAAPSTLLEQFINIWKSPIWWLVLFNVGLTCFVLYHYWADHGRGALQRKDNV